MASNENFFTESVPEFLVGFKKIKDSGFFESLSLEIRSFEGRGSTYIKLQGTGYIPTDTDSMPSGVNTFVDPEALLIEVRRVVESSVAELRTIRIEVKTDTWHLYDEEGENVIGSRGFQTEFFLILQLIDPKQ